MKVKKFIAPTMPEAMTRVRKELGNDAVILHSKVIYTGGFLGLFKKRNTEVIAAIDPDIERNKNNNSKEVASTENNEIKQPHVVKHQETDQQQVLLEELRSLRKSVEKTTANQTLSSFSAAFQRVYDHLINQEVNASLAVELITDVQQQFNQDNINEVQAMRLLQTEIQARLEQIGCGGITYRKQFVHFVGPTGVGKTTTIAKLAAKAMLKDHKKVALITTDTYRIAAIEQLKTYSKILDIPLEIAYSIDDFQKAKQTFKDYDLVLVDTAGRNFRDPRYIKELGQVVDLEHDIDTYLVLSMTTKPADLEAIYQQFQNVPLEKFIFTKADETAYFGSILNLTLSNNLGVAYVTNGQDVPDDIEEATSLFISNLVAGEINHG